MRKFLVVIERIDAGNYSAYSPDLPRDICVATGSTREEVEQRMAEAMRLHVEGLREDRLPIPESRAFAEYIAVG